jgi:hypothetical protein
MTKELREQIQSVARSYLNVPWRHQGRTREFGLDCMGLPIAVARDIGLTVADFVSYGLQPDWPTLYRFLHPNAFRISIDEKGPGDLVLLENEGVPHGAILPDGGAPFSIIHSWQPNKKVIEALFDETLSVRGYYRYRGLEELCPLSSA